MLVPTRIEVRNIRSVTHAVIEPLAEGITALSGRIGSGKSSLVNALAWCLFGEIGGIEGLLAQSEMRRDGAEDEPVEAIVDFTVAGDRYRAVRRLRRATRKGQSVEVASAELWINDVKQSQITPSKLTEKITAVTGMTGRAFVGAGFIPQHELPTLAEGSPSEVQRLIEDQTGLAALTRRLETANREAGKAQTEADALPGSMDEVATAQGEVDAAQADAVTKWDTTQAATSAVEQARARLEEAKARHTDLATARDAAQLARLARARAEERHSIAESCVNNLTSQVQKLPEQQPTAAVQERLQALRQMRAAADRARVAHDHARARLEDTRAAHEQARGVASQYPPDLDSQMQAAGEHARAAADEVSALRAEYQRLRRGVETLTAAEPGAAACPTCNQQVGDLPTLVADLSAQRDAIAARGRTARDRVQAAETTLEELSAQVRGRDAATENTDRRKREHDQAVAVCEQTECDRNEVIAQLRTLAQLPPDIDEDDVLERAGEAEQAAHREITNAEHAQQLRDELTSAQTELANASAELTRLAEHSVSDVDDETLAAAHAAVQAAEDEFTRLDGTRQQAQSASDVATERVRGAEAARDREQSLVETKMGAAEHADTLRNAARLLSELRRDLLADYTAAITTAATDLMTQVGEAQHVGVAIDEEFIPRVVLSDGRTRPTRALSGGEKARAALCLRLGITEQITAGAPGMIYADEITSGYDEQTTQLIVELMRDLGRPMVAIAHADEVAQVANRVYRFDKSNGDTTVTSA